MLMVDLVQRVLRVDGAVPVRDFLGVLNDQVNQVWEDFRWPYYVTELSVSASLSFDNLTVTNGATTATVVDVDAGGLFHALHVGKQFTIEDVQYTVSSVTDANTLVISTVSEDTGTGLAGSLPRVVYALPSNFGRLYGAPYPSSILNRDVDAPCFYLEDPQDYRITGPSSGIYTLELRTLLTEAYTLRYIRRPTACTGPGSTVDVDSPLEKVIFQGVLGHLLQRVEARNELHLAQLQQRIRRADGLYMQYLREARGVAASVDEGVRRNRSWGF